MQVSIATTAMNAKSFTPLSPPLSPNSKIGIMKPEASSIYSSHQSPIQVTKSSSSTSSSSPSPSPSPSLALANDSVEQKNVVESSTKPKNKFRMRICDAPPELLDLIRRSEEKNEKPLPNKSSSIINASVLSKSVSKVSVQRNDSSSRKPVSVDEKRHRIRKNPYPRKAPSKSSPGITLRVDVYTTLKEDPKALLQRNGPSTATYPTSTTHSYTSSSTDGSSSESTPPHSPVSHRSSPKSQIAKTKTKTKRSKPVISERKRKGNSLARVMADRGLLESTLTPIVVSGEIKPIRIPPPPPMQFEELMSNIEQLNLDFTLLNRISPKISWKGQPLSISHLPHYDSLHQKEAHVASTLRLTPVQYLTAKNTLISSARRYAQKSLPFRKSDAQKLLRIDVNKASKLWEFFMQVKWI